MTTPSVLEKLLVRTQSSVIHTQHYLRLHVLIKVTHCSLMKSKTLMRESLSAKHEIVHENCWIYDKNTYLNASYKLTRIACITNSLFILAHQITMTAKHFHTMLFNKKYIMNEIISKLYIT